MYIYIYIYKNVDAYATPFEELSQHSTLPKKHSVVVCRHTKLQEKTSFPSALPVGRSAFGFGAQQIAKDDGIRLVAVGTRRIDQQCFDDWKVVGFGCTTL